MKSSTAKEIIKEFTEVTGGIDNEYTRKWKKNSGKVIGYVCCQVPKELIMAAGFLPFRIRGTGSTSTELAEKYTGFTCCSFPRHFFNQVLKGKYDFLDGAVFTNNCDHYRRLFDNWKRSGINTPFMHMISNPKRIAEQAVLWYIDEMTALIEHMQEHFKITVSDDNIREAIRLSNKTRRLQRKIYELRKGENPPISGADTLSIMVASTAMPLDQYNVKLENLLNELKNIKGEKKDLRLMIISSCLDNPVFVEMIEDMAGTVVTDFTCFGTKIMWNDINEDTENPYRALAEYHLSGSPSCPRLYGDHSRRLAHVMNLIKEYKVDGVIGDWLIFCDTWSVFHHMLKQDLEQAGIPFLMMEREYIPSFMGQLKTRVQAFAEILRR